MVPRNNSSSWSYLLRSPVMVRSTRKYHTETLLETPNRIVAGVVLSAVPVTV